MKSISINILIQCTNCVSVGSCIYLQAFPEVVALEIQPPFCCAVYESYRIHIIIYAQQIIKSLTNLSSPLNFISC